MSRGWGFEAMLVFPAKPLPPTKPVYLFDSHDVESSNYTPISSIEAQCFRKKFGSRDCFFTPKSAHTKAKAKVWALFLRNAVIHLSAAPAIKAGYFFVTALFR